MAYADGLADYWAGTTLLSVAQTVLPDYLPRTHTDHLAAVLSQAVEDAENGKDTRIVVEMPPGEGKSSICSVAAPLYALARNPTWEIALVSAEQSLATKWSRDCQRAVADGMVPGVGVSAQTTAVTEWETTDGGSFLARGVGGAITGRRIKVLVIDDPVKGLADAHSKVQREMLWDRWQSVLKTRMRPGSVVVLVQTRWHEDDLAGRLLKTGDWLEVRFPAIAEDEDVLGREPGEPLLSPMVEETSEQALARWAQIRGEVGEYVWNALYQQRPSPPGGVTFKSGWWLWHDDDTRPNPTLGNWLTSWDLTFGFVHGSGKADYVVGQVWQHYEGTAYLIDQVRDRWTFNEQMEQIRMLAARYPQCNTHLIEKAASGTDIIGTLKREISGIIPVKPEGPKEIRAIAVAPMVEAGQVSLPRDRSWSDRLLAELTGFPTSVQNDDQVDALTQALKRLGAPYTGVVTANPALTALPSTVGGFRGRSF